jgi:hypothetical protein
VDAKPFLILNRFQRFLFSTRKGKPLKRLDEILVVALITRLKPGENEIKKLRG